VFWQFWIQRTVTILVVETCLKLMSWQYSGQTDGQTDDMCHNIIRHFQCKPLLRLHTTKTKNGIRTGIFYSYYYANVFPAATPALYFLDKERLHRSMMQFIIRYRCSQCINIIKMNNVCLIACVVNCSSFSMIKIEQPLLCTSRNEDMLFALIIKLNEKNI